MFMRFLLATIVATLLLAVPASAYKVTITVHGAGAVNEITNRGLIDQATGLDNFSEATTTVLTAGSSSGLYAAGDIVELDAYVPAEYAARGWYFERWVDAKDVANKVNCDPQDVGGNHTNRRCRFQIWQDLSIDLYFRDQTGPLMASLGGTPSEGTTTGSTSATVTFDANQPDARFECRLEREGVVVEDWFLCGGPTDKTQAFSGLTTSGQYTALVRAMDPSGNRGPSVTRSWRVDNDFPDTSITGGPTTVSGASATFTFAATESGSFQCRLDNGPWVGCTSPHFLTGLPEGQRTLYVAATDHFGHTDATPAQRTWVVDATAPDTTLSPAHGPAHNSSTKNRAATFEFSATGGATKFYCRLDRGTTTGTPGECASPYATGELTDGTYTFHVWAEDAVGNVESEHATRTWTVDTTPPDTTFTDGPANGSSTEATSATFSWTSTEAVTHRCSLDGVVTTECVSPHTVSELERGTHTLVVVAVDAAGNEDPTPPSRSWTVADLTPAETVITGGPADGSSTTDTSATFTLSGTDAASFRCSLDGAAPSACASPLALSGLTPGAHTLKVWAADASGNEDATPATRSWSVLATVVQPPIVELPPLLPAANPARLSVGQKAKRRHTTLSKLTLTALPAGSTVAVRCRGKRCPARAFSKTAGGTLKLTKFLRRKLPVGTVLQITVTRAGFEGKRFTLKIRAGKKARLQTTRLT